MSDRFYSAEPIVADQLTLDGPEAHHLLHVLRAEVGRRVVLFDGQGAEFAAEVIGLERAAVRLRVLQRREANRELPFRLVVGVALPKGARQKWLIEKLTELGATALVPLVTERGVAQPTGATLDRLRRTVIEAAKQCGRNRLMEIAEPQSWAQWAMSETSEPPNRRLVAHPGGEPLAQLDLSLARPTQLAIGPEGGWTDAEITDAVDAGWQTVDLGPRILRVETAAVALTAAVVALRPGS